MSPRVLSLPSAPRFRMIPVTWLGLALVAASRPAAALSQSGDEKSRVAAAWGRKASAGEFKLEEIGRARGKRSTDVTYRMVTSGLPAGKTYELWMRQSGDRKVGRLAKGYATDAEGALTCPPGEPKDPGFLGGMAESIKAKYGVADPSCKPGMALLEWKFTIHDYRMGEPLELAVISTDGGARAYARAFPFPIEARDGSCQVTLELRGIEGRQFWAYGSGFGPGETVATKAAVANQVVEASDTADAGGSWSRPLDLEKVKPSSGTAVYTATGQACGPAVTLGYGSLSEPLQ